VIHCTVLRDRPNGWYKDGRPYGIIKTYKTTEFFLSI
jgi:hypothetical protein